MTSLNSNIDDLRREMFYGRVRIDGINPPPENILDPTMATTINSSGSIVNISAANNGTINVRLPTNQMLQQRPLTFPPVNNVTTQRPMQPQQQQQQQLQLQSTQAAFRPTIQTIQQPARQIRPAATAVNATGAVFATQPVLNISNVNLRTIAPSSQLRPSFVPNTISTNQIRAVAVSTAALQNIKSAPVVNSNGGGNDELKIEAVTSLSTEQHQGKDQLIQLPQQQLSQQTGGGSNSVSLPTNILNHHNYRNKLNEIIKSEAASNGTATGPGNATTVLHISDDALAYVSEAMENFSLTLLEQAAVFACHRQELFRDNPTYRKVDDVRSQMKFLQELEEYQRASEEERQKAELFKQAKSRSKMDNQEQQKIKETVRKIQEHDKNCDEYTRANSTALKAIGNKRKLIDCGGVLGGPNGDEMGGMGLGGAGGVLGGGVGVGAKVQRFVGNAAMGNANGNGGVSAFGAGINSGGNVSSGSNSVATGNSIGGVINNHNQHVTSSGQIFINQNFLATKGGIRNPAVARFRNKRIILKDFQLVLDQDVKLKRFKTYKKIFTYGRY